MKNKRPYRTLLWMAIALIAVHFININTSFSFQFMGILPRDTKSWYHIFTAPLIHGSWSHLLNNLLGLVVFGALAMVQSVNHFIRASLFINVVTGALVWAFARPAMHIGASGWVFGLWSLLIITAWFDRRLVNIIIALFVLIFYGGMIYGVLPTEKGISFESHLFGAVAGIIYAIIIKKSRRK